MAQRKTGQIVSLEPTGHVLVQIYRQGGCGGNCAHGQIFGPTNSELTLTATNDINAAVGDWVDIEYDSSLALKAAFGIYLFPLLAGLAAYLISNSLLAADSSWWAYIIAGFVIAVSFNYCTTYFGAQDYTYSVVAYADAQELTIAPGCQGCQFVHEK